MLCRLSAVRRLLTAVFSAQSCIWKETEDLRGAAALPVSQVCAGRSRDGSGATRQHSARRRQQPPPPLPLPSVVQLKDAVTYVSLIGLVNGFRDPG